MDGVTGLAPHDQGYVDERSIAHVKGWLRDLNNEATRLEYEVVLPQAGSERVLAAAGRCPSAIFWCMGRPSLWGDGTYAFSCCSTVN